MSDLYVDRLNFRDGTVMGTPIQTVLTTTSAYQLANTVVPADDTIPTSSEGTELTNLTTSFTPKTVGNTIVVTVRLFFSSSTAVNAVAILLKDAGAAAVAAAGQGCSGANAYASLVFSYKETVTSTDAISFKVRLGPTGAASLYLNGSSGAARLFGGVASSSILIEEIQA